MSEFKILNCTTMEPVRNVACQFMFQGYEISLSTWAGSKWGMVAVYKDDKFILECDSPEEAINYVMAQA